MNVVGDETVRAILKAAVDDPWTVNVGRPFGEPEAPLAFLLSGSFFYRDVLDEDVLASGDRDAIVTHLKAAVTEAIVTLRAEVERAIETLEVP